MENQFTIYKQYKDETAKNPVTMSDFIRLTEGKGAYNKDTALEALKLCGMIQTDWAWYTIKYK